MKGMLSYKIVQKKKKSIVLKCGYVTFSFLCLTERKKKKNPVIFTNLKFDLIPSHPHKITLFTLFANLKESITT